MKAVILAGGYGTRLSEETTIKPKPLVEIGNKPILWHIMKIYSTYDVNDFIICSGYKGELIKQFFANYIYLFSPEITFNLENNTVELHQNHTEPWKVTIVDTGEKTMTGGRIKRVSEHIGDEPFFLTYGDGISDLNINDLLTFHRSQKSLATLTAVQPPGRFGAFTLEEGETKILNFREKPSGDGAWINGGFFVLEPEVLNYIEGDHTVWEQEPLERLAHDEKLSAYRHCGFWHPMDTLRDKMFLEELWQSGNAPWKVWL